MTLAHLEAELDAPCLALSAVADWHAEQGDDCLAAAYRWLARERKWPGCAGDFWRWVKHDERWPHAGTWTLPQAVYLRFRQRPLQIGLLPQQARSCAAAFRMAAESIAELIALGEWQEATP